MKIESSLFNRPILRHRIHAAVRIVSAIKRVGYERRDGAERKRRKVKNTRGENFRRAGAGRARIPGGADETRSQGADLEVFEAVPALVELGQGFIFPGAGLHRRNRASGGFGPGGGVCGAGEHLDHLFEGGGVSLDEGGRVGVVRVGSCDGNGGAVAEGGIGGGGW